MRCWWAPVWAMTLAGLILGSSVLGSAALVAVLLVVVVMLAAGWPTLLGLPTKRGSATVLALAGTTAVVVVALTCGLGRSIGVPADPDAMPMQQLRWLAPVLALSVVASFTHQLLRRDFRPRLVESVTGVVSGTVVVALTSGWLASALVTHGEGLVRMAAGAIVGGVLPLLVRLPSLVVGPLLTLMGALGAAALGGALGHLPLWPALATGALIGVTIVCFDRLFSELPSATSKRAGLAHGAALVCTAGGVTFLTAGLFA